jgi:hypothetical protein
LVWNGETFILKISLYISDWNFTAFKQSISLWYVCLYIFQIIYWYNMVFFLVIGVKLKIRYRQLVSCFHILFQITDGYQIISFTKDFLFTLYSFLLKQFCFLYTGFNSCCQRVKTSVKVFCCISNLKQKLLYLFYL